MKNILEELYYGNINPNSKQFISGSDYEKAIKTLAANEDKLTECLKDEERALFIGYTNAQKEINGIEATENFIDGFRLGAKIMIEVMGDENGCLRNIL